MYAITDTIAMHCYIRYCYLKHANNVIVTAAFEKGDGCGKCTKLDKDQGF